MLRKKKKNESSGFSFSGQAEISILWAADIRPDWCLTFHTRPVLMSLLCLCVTSVQWEYCWHRSVAPVMSGVWNSSAVSSAAPCRPALQWFYPLWAPGSIAPGLASLACYNETDMPGMWVCILLRTPPNSPPVTSSAPSGSPLNTHCTTVFSHHTPPHSIPLTPLLLPPWFPSSQAI